MYQRGRMSFRRAWFLETLTSRFTFNCPRISVSPFLESAILRRVKVRKEWRSKRSKSSASFRTRKWGVKFWILKNHGPCEAMSYYIEFETRSSKIEISENDLHLLHHNVGVVVFHKFMGFAVPSVASSWISSELERETADFARLYACFATRATRLR